MKALHNALETLTDATPRTRDIAAAELGDLLRGNALDEATAAMVVSRLVDFTVNEPIATVRESALNSISEAFKRGIDRAGVTSQRRLPLPPPRCSASRALGRLRPPHRPELAIALRSACDRAEIPRP